MHASTHYHHATASGVAPAALALSGGGLRAALFQQGCFLALAMRGELGSIKHIGAISGGTLAALVLRQAHSDVAKLATQPGAGTDHQLSLVLHAERHLSRLAARNLRSRALLSWKSVASAVLFGALNLTRRFAEDINRTIEWSHSPGEEPFTLRIGVHDLANRRAAHVTLGHRHDVGILAAAAMSIPGLMESLVIEPSIGPVCDGGVDDKTAFQLLLDAGQAVHEVLVLDASTEAQIDPKTGATPMASLMALMERNSETLRTSHSSQASQMVGWVSLRDANNTNCGLNVELLGFLQKSRTDLNHFSAVEQLALAATGFILTLDARGETRQDILKSAARLPTLEIVGPKGRVRYPLATLFADVCRALLDAESHQWPASLWGRMKSWGCSTIKESLSVVLEKSVRKVGRDIGSPHALGVAIGALSAGWAMVVGSYFLALLALLFMLAALGIATVFPLNPWEAGGLLWVGLGMLMTAFAYGRVQPPGASSTLARLVAGTVLLPILLSLTAAARCAVLAVHEGEGAWALRYKQTTVGRLRAMVSSRDAPQHVREKPVLMFAMTALLLVVGVFNPFTVVNWISPRFVNEVAHLDALGLDGVFKYSPLQPAFLVLLILEWIATAFFVGRSVLRLAWLKVRA